MTELPEDPRPDEAPEAPEAPPAAEATGAPEEASKVDLDEDERPAPPVRARDAGTEDEAPPPGVVGPADAAVAEELPPEVEPARRPQPPRATASDDAVIPGADLEPDIVLEGDDPLARAEGVDEEQLLEEGAPPAENLELPEADEAVIPQAAISLAAGARYRATGKRKTAVARVILRPGTGAYTVNGRALEAFFPRLTLQRQIRQPLETVGYAERMDVVATLHGGGVSAQAGALRHGISRALIEADPNLRTELKRRGFLTRDARVKERKKAGLKKARKRPQFSKR
jgi:small subunit ribosomal protein S9